MDTSLGKQRIAPAVPATRLLGSGLLRALLFVLLWWILAGGAATSWLVGVPTIALATLVSGLLLPPLNWSLLGIVRFVPFFLWQSLRGGTDVAWRAVHPKLPIAPDIIDYPLHLPAGLPRVFMVNTVSLLPGTLGIGLRGDFLRVHVLDAQRDVLSELRTVEEAVRRIFTHRPVRG